MSEINYEIISQYVDGQLTGEALLAFEKEMQANAELANEVALYKTINEELAQQVNNEKEEQALTNNLKGLSEKHFKKEQAKVKGINRWWYAAAAAAAIIIIVVRPFSPEPFNNEKLFAYYMKDAERLPAVQRGNNDDTLLLKAANFYNNKDYPNALPLLQNILTRKPDETELHLAAGICYLQTGQYDSASKVFDQIAGGSTVFNTQATWYKALVFLKQNKIDECYHLLATLSKDADKYEAAQQLMKKIDSQRTP
jgi:tetratricopeptide (TPR) repeat protein